MPWRRERGESVTVLSVLFAIAWFALLSLAFVVVGKAVADKLRVSRKQ